MIFRKIGFEKSKICSLKFRFVLKNVFLFVDFEIKCLWIASLLSLRLWTYVEIFFRFIWIKFIIFSQEYRAKRVRHDSYHRISKSVFLSIIYAHQKKNDLDSAEVYQSFFITHTCYDCMPKSGKVLLLDGQLSIRKAFFALVFNGVRAALIWHAPTSSTIGLITISDFINMLISAYDSKWVNEPKGNEMTMIFVLCFSE